MSSSSLKVHPLHLPELLLATAEHLNKREIASCLSVCRTWNTILLPQLWQSITITGPAKTNSSFPSLVAKNARHIRYLVHVNDDFFSHATSNFPLVLTRLVRLDVTRLTGLWVMALIRSRSTLQSFRWLHREQMFGFGHLFTEDDCPIFDAFWEAIEGCHSLNTLEIPYVALEKEHSSIFSTLCLKLSVLSLRIMDTRYLPTQGILPSARFPKMKQLSLKSRFHGTTSEMLRFIHQCRNLTHLELDSVELYGEPIQETVAASLKPLLSQLKKLSINGMSDRVMASLWQELPLATHLLAEAYGIECNRFLINPINRGWACQLRELYISHSLFSGTINVSDVLTICSGLRKFATTHIDVKDMTLPGISVDYRLENLRPWVCLELEELKTEFITTTPDSNGCISLVCTQIAKLKHLRSLNLEPVFRVFRSSHHGVPALRFTLGKGLELLETLTKLEYLHLGNDVTIETTQDLDWMMEHLPSLREVRGALNRDPERNKELHKHMQEPCARAPGRWFKVDPPPINHFTFGSASSSIVTRNSIVTTTVEPPALYSGPLFGDTSALTTSTGASTGSLFGSASIFGPSPAPLFGSASTLITPAFGTSTSSLFGTLTSTTSVGASTGSLFGNVSATTASTSGAGTSSLFGTVRTSTISAGTSTGSRFRETPASTTSSSGTGAPSPFGNTSMSTATESGARAAPLFGPASTSTTWRFGAPANTSAPVYSNSALSAASLGLALPPTPTGVTPVPLTGPFGSTTAASASFGTTVTAAPQPFACSVTARPQPFSTTGAQVNLSPSGAAPPVYSSTGFSARNSSVPDSTADDSDL